MYNVTDDYKYKIGLMDRIFKLEIRIEHSTGTLLLEDKHIAQGTFVYTDASQPSDEFTIGGTVANQVEFTLVNKSEYDGINFIGAKVIPTVAILIREAVDAHFIQPSQPSKMQGFDDKWEYVPLGYFNIDVADKNRSTIDIKALDNMILLDKPYALSSLTYPTTLQNILINICSVADVPLSTINFKNDSHTVNQRPAGDLTLRNVVGFIAELSGTFAKFNRLGQLELKWYTSTDLLVTSTQRSSLKTEDYGIQVTGVSFTSVDTDASDNEILYVTGTEGYIIDITGNPLLQDNYSTVLPQILLNIDGTLFTPYMAEWNGNPAMDSGDKITHIDVDGNVIPTLITNMSYKYRGKSTVSGKGLPNISRGFESTDNRIAHIIQRVEKETGDKLTSLEEAQLQATELIANTLGGYSTRTEDAFYIHDALLLDNSQKIWKWGLGGFGYSDDGGLSYSVGITADKSIIAKTITADMIRTGVLEGITITGNTITGNTITGGIINGANINGSIFSSENNSTFERMRLTEASFSIWFERDIHYYPREVNIRTTGMSISDLRSNYNSFTGEEYGSLDISHSGIQFFSENTGGDVITNAKIGVGNNKPAGSPLELQSDYGFNFNGNVNLGQGIIRGSIVEVGGSSTNKYIKFSDGTMIIHLSQTVNVTMSAITPINTDWMTASTGDIYYASTFISPPTVLPMYPAGEIISATRIVTNSYCSFKFYSPYSYGSYSRDMGVIAIGRWK